MSGAVCLPAAGAGEGTPARPPPPPASDETPLLIPNRLLQLLMPPNSAVAEGALASSGR